MEIEVNIEDCFWSTAQSADVRNSQAPVLFNEQIPPETWDLWFRHWLEILYEELPPAPAYELSLRLSDDGDIQELNAQYRHQNKPTDVLAFAALEFDCPQPAEARSQQPLYLGDIIISVDTANRQAAQQSHPLQTELAWLAAHGLLHLIGWDHPDEESLNLMIEKQETLLQAIGLINKDNHNTASSECRL